MAFSGPLEDRQLIRELMDSYADAICRVDVKDYSACWADEGAVWSIPWYPEIGTVEGKDKIIPIWVEAMKVFAGDNFVMVPGSIEVDGKCAKVTAHTSECYDIGDTIFRDRGYYMDECVKIEGRWYFQKRIFYLKHRETSFAKSEDREFTKT